MTDVPPCFRYDGSMASKSSRSEDDKETDDQKVLAVASGSKVC